MRILSGFGKSRIKGIVVALLTVFTVMALNVPVLAYTQFDNARWASVDPLYFGLDSSSGDSDAAWDQSAANWTNAGTPVYLVNDDWAYDVYLSDTYDSSAFWDGIMPTNERIVYLGTIQTASGYLNTYYTASYATNKRISATGHELGHIIVLGHSSGAVLMNYSTSSRYDTYGVYTPQTDDINGVNYYY